MRGVWPSPQSLIVRFNVGLVPVPQSVMPCATSRIFSSDHSSTKPPVAIFLPVPPSKKRETASRMLLGASAPFGSILRSRASLMRRASTELTIFSTRAASARLCWFPPWPQLFSTSP